VDKARNAVRIKHMMQAEHAPAWGI
jgi:hypothetical protein